MSEENGESPPVDNGENDEKGQAEEHKRPPVAVVHEVIRSEGEHELGRRASALFWSGLAAGMSMSFSMLTMAVFRHALPRTAAAHLFVELGYPVGFLVVVMGRQQLFTENTLTPVLAVLEDTRLAMVWKLLRLWGIVLAANVIGAFVFDLAAVHTAILPPEVKAECLAIGNEVLEAGPGTHFLRAVLAGWMIASMVWILPSAEQSRFWVIVLLTYLVGVLGLSHIVAGTVEAAYALLSGASSPQDFALHFFFPTLAGNVLGGTSLVAALSHAQVAADKQA